MGPTSALVSNIIDNLRRVFQLLNEQSKRAEHDTGITGPQLWAIKIISESEPIKSSDLARKMYLHPATIVGIIDRLEARGLVERRKSTRDRRIVEIALTDAGRLMVSQSPEEVQGLLVSGLESLPDTKLKNLSKSMEQLTKLIDTQIAHH